MRALPSLHPAERSVVEPVFPIEIRQCRELVVTSAPAPESVTPMAFPSAIPFLPPRVATPRPLHAIRLAR
jgi:hypothetical protein